MTCFDSPKSKYVLFTLTQDQENQKMFTFEKLWWVNIWLNNVLRGEWIIKIVAT